MCRTRSTAALVAALFVATGVAHAQPAPRAPAKPAPPAPPLPRFAPVIDDPLLAPPAGARTELASWADAQRLLASGATDIRRAQARVARAAARVRGARAALLPTADLSAAATMDLLHPGTAPGVPPGPDYAPTSPLGTLTLSASQSLLDVAAWRGRAVAAADQRGAVANRVDAERRVAQQVARAIITVAASERAAELNRVGLRQSLERAALGKRTFELGAATELDVVRTAQDVALARSALIAGDDELQVAREALALALGVEGDVGVRAGLAGDGLLAELAARCRPLRGDEERADLAAAEAEVEAARALRAQARAGYLPTVDLTTSVSAFTTDPAPGQIPSWSLALVLRVPIWEGGQRAATLAERAAAEAEAVAVTADVRRAARVEFTRARRGGEVAGALVATAAEARALAEKIDAMTRRSFEIGRATSLELVQSAAALRQAELTLSLREFARQGAQIDALLTESRCVP